MSLNKNLYSYPHKKFEVILFFKVCKKNKMHSLIYCTFSTRTKGII